MDARLDEHRMRQGGVTHSARPQRHGGDSRQGHTGPRTTQRQGPAGLGQCPLQAQNRDILSILRLMRLRQHIGRAVFARPVQNQFHHVAGCVRAALNNVRTGGDQILTDHKPCADNVRPGCVVDLNDSVT